MKQKHLSVCLVVKNEEKYLWRCLESIKNIAGEIIVVDTGSTDRTIEIAKQFTDRIFEIKWRDDFSKARNFALRKASCDWILFLDGDEELDSTGTVPLCELIAKSDCEGFLIKVINYHQAPDRVETAPDLVFRLFRNKKEYRYTGTIHEQIYDNIIAVNPLAKIEIADNISIIHYGYLPEEIAAKNKAARNMRLLLKAVRKNPHNLLNHFHLGVEYFRTNLLEKALEEFLFVAARGDLKAVYVPKLMSYITKCHYLLGDLKEALRFIDDVWIKTFKDHGDLYYLKGIIYRDLGRPAEAYSSFKKSLTVPPQPAHYANLYCQYRDKIYHQLGELCEYSMDKETALKYYVKAVEENPRSINSLTRIVSILNPENQSSL